MKTIKPITTKECGICNKSIFLDKDDYVHLEDFNKGMFYMEGWYHLKCYNYNHNIKYILLYYILYIYKTLTGNDFLRVLSQPQYVLLGFLSQFTIMPLLASNIGII